VTCVTCQTITAAQSKDRLEDLCRWYASELDRLMSRRTPSEDDDLKAEVAELRRNMSRQHQTILKQNAVIEDLRKAKT
jgi:hypothetical protein